MSTRWRVWAWLLTIVLSWTMTGEAWAQSVGIGVGVGVPLTTYVEDEVDREFRVSPTPGYYPLLRERNNSPGSSLYLTLQLDHQLLEVFDDIEIRLDIGTFGWSEAEVTHTACEPVDLIDGAFDDATTVYYPVDEANCLDDDHQTRSDLTELELAALQVFGLSFSGRYHLLHSESWLVWLMGGAGLSVATFEDPGASYYFGGQALGGAGFSYRVGDVVSLDLHLRLVAMLTESPDSLENRINHDAQTSGNIFTILFETFTYVDLTFGLRFDIGGI